MSAKPFTFPIKVLPDDIDFMGHVNNARYLNWVQDTVLAHWQKLAPAEEVATHVVVPALPVVSAGDVEKDYGHQLGLAGGLAGRRLRA